MNITIRTIAATVLRSVYGYQLKGLDDPFLVEARTAVDNIMKAWLASSTCIVFYALKTSWLILPKDFMVNAIPALVHVPDWFPGTSWKQAAREWGKQKDHVVQTTYNWAKTRHVRIMGRSHEYVTNYRL